MKIYVVVTGENAITVSLNGEAAVAKTVKPTLTALGNGRIRFQCDDIDEEVETYRNIFINAIPLKGSWIAEEDYLSVTLFEAIMNKTFSGSSPGGSSYLEYYAKMNAAGTDDPTLNSESNGLGGAAITWAYSGTPGYYHGSRDGGFPLNRTLVFVTSGADPFVIQGRHYMPEDVIALFGFDETWGALNGLTDVSVRIVILPE